MLVEVASPIPRRLHIASASPARWRQMAGGMTPYLYLLPALIGLVIWVYVPLMETFRYSFFSWDLLPTEEPVAVGLRNYQQLVAMPQMWSALRITGIYTLGLVVFGVVLPVVVGVLAHQVGGRARSVYSGLIFVPVLVSPIVASTIWQFLLAPRLGIVNEGLALVGIHGVNWLSQPNPARLGIVLVAGWKVLGVSVLIVTAGLASINVDYYDAAEIDGASRWQTFGGITLPLLSPTVLFLVIISVLLSSQITFPLINSMTLGGPSGATTDIYYLLYVFGFTSFDVGTAASAATLFFVGFGIVAILCVRLQDRFSFYDN